MLPDVESETVRAEVACQEAVSARVTRTIEESLAREAVRIQPLEDRSQLRRIDERLGRIGAIQRRAVSVDSTDVRSEGDAHVPRSQSSNLLEKFRRHSSPLVVADRNEVVPKRREF